MNDSGHELRRECLIELEQWAHEKAQVLPPEEIWRLLLGAVIATAQAALTPPELADCLRQAADAVERNAEPKTIQ